MRAKPIVFFVSIMIFSLLFHAMPVQAQTTKNYVYNEYAEAVNAPNAYTSGRILRGRELGIGDFSKITDIYVNDNIYIADSGNNRIVVLNPDYQLVRIIDSVEMEGERSMLGSPQGVFLKDELLYICDTANARVIAINEEDTVVKTYTKPSSDLLTEDFEFKPSKVVVNSAGSVFVGASGVYQGLLHYDNDGTFLEFFGANKVEVTLQVIMKSMWMNIFSKEQRESLVRSVPTEYAGIFIDSESMIYTTTITAQESQVKRLNASGENILIYPGSSGSLLQKGYNRNNFGDQQTDSVKGAIKRSELMDVDVDEDGIIAVLDAQRGRVFLFDSEQNPLCIFGGSGSQEGCFVNASALGKSGEDYLVSDYDTNSITVFEPTEYMQNIKAALRTYAQGNYEESRMYWKRVIEKNAGLAVAFKGVGRTLLLEGDYEESMDYLKKGDDRYYYSLALTSYRRDYLRENSVWLIPCVAAAVILFVIAIRRIRRAILKSAEGRNVQ